MKKINAYHLLGIGLLVFIGVAMAQQLPYYLITTAAGPVATSLTTGIVPNAPAILAKCQNAVGQIADCDFGGGPSAGTVKTIGVTTNDGVSGVSDGSASDPKLTLTLGTIAPNIIETKVDTTGRKILAQSSSLFGTYIDVYNTTGSPTEVQLVAGGFSGYGGIANGHIGLYDPINSVTDLDCGAAAVGCILHGNVDALTFNWTLNSGAAATDAAPRQLAAHAGSINNCYVLTTASDGSTAFTFNVFKNGSTILGGAQTVAAGTAAGTISTFASVTTFANNDIVSINVTAGTSSWIVSVQCKK